MARTNVLFLCTGNSARSQMAEALLRHHAGDRFEAYSAGLEPQGLNPYTVRAMAEIGLDLAGQRSKPLAEVLGQGQFDYLITVCGDADKRCPSTLPGLGRRLHWPFEDPAAFAGSEEDILDKFRQVRDQIEERIKEWLAQEPGQSRERALEPAELQTIAAKVSARAAPSEDGAADLIDEAVRSGPRP